MARTSITPTAVNPHTPVEYLETESDPVAGMEVPKARLLFIRMENRGAVTAVVTVEPGSPMSGAFMAHSAPRLEIVIPPGETRLLGELESAKYSHGNSYWLNVDQPGVFIGAIRRPGGA